MPYEEHELFTDPEKTTKLWRYLDFAKFISILDTNALFFPSARTLQKIDPWEGIYLKKELSFMLKDRVWEKRNPSLKVNDINLSDYEIAKNLATDWKAQFEYQIDTNFISCWHYNSYESAAMWKLYLKSNEGLCIQTDVESFKKSFIENQKRVFIGMVRYKDYENDAYYTDYNKNKLNSEGFNMFLPFIHKRKIYEHEKEYRAIVPFNADNEKKKNGLMMKINLNTLIKRIILAPSCTVWFEELVNAILEKYNLNFEVSKSIVDDKPYEFDLSPYKPKRVN